MSHEWKKRKLLAPGQCFSCRKPIWPFSSAMRCTHCFLQCHKACALKTTVKCNRIASQSYMALGVVKVRVIKGLNIDPTADCVCTIRMEQQIATTRIAFKSSVWNQTFVFVETTKSKGRLILECYEQDYMNSVFLGTAIIPTVYDYLQYEEITVDMQRGGVKTKTRLVLGLEYHQIYSHAVEWHVGSNPSSPYSTSSTPQRVLRRRHSASNTSPEISSSDPISKSKPELPVLPTEIASSSTSDLSSSPKILTQSASLHSVPARSWENSPTQTLTSTKHHYNTVNTSSSTIVNQFSASIVAQQENRAPTTSENATASTVEDPSNSIVSRHVMSTPVKISKRRSKIVPHEPVEDELDEVLSDEDPSEHEDGLVSFRDHFGFPIDADSVDAYLSMFEFQFTTRLKEQSEYFAANLNKMISTNPLNPIISKELVGFCKAGIPLALRGELWQTMSGSKDALSRHPGLYKRILEKHRGVSNASTIQIQKDLKRTFISNPFLRSSNDLHKLQKVLTAFCFYEPSIGYCQSLNFIAALFLLLMDEEESFWLLVVMAKKFLPDYYSPDMSGSKTDSHIFEAMLFTYFPLLSHKLFDLGLPVVLRTASWFLCMFVTILPIETTMRIFDWMFVEGSHILISVGLTLFDLHQHDLSQADSFDSAYFIFNAMTSHCYNADNLVHLASTKYQLVKKEIAALRHKLRLEFARRDDTELLASLSLSPEDFYSLVNQLEEQVQVGSDPGTALLSKQKLVAVFQKVFPDVPPSACEAVFDALDVDDDEALTFKECLLGISVFFQGDPEKKAAMWFRVFDRNNDGVLDTAEIKNLLGLVWKLIDKKLENSWIDQFLKVVETEHAGKMTRKEFSDACIEMPVLSEWLRFGITIGDRLKVLQAQQQVKTKSSPPPDSDLPPLVYDSADEQDWGSSPPNTWLDGDEKLNPSLVKRTISPRDSDGGLSDDHTDLEESEFYLV